jgi:6-phosphogluconate dehydrogenase
MPAPHTNTHTTTQGGCIIRAGFLDRIKQAYLRDAALPNLLVDPAFAKVC